MCGSLRKKQESLDTTAPQKHSTEDWQLKQQACPQPPPPKKGKSASGTPCAQPSKEDAQPLARKTPVSQGIEAITDTFIDEDDCGGKVTPGLSCS